MSVKYDVHGGGNRSADSSSERFITSHRAVARGCVVSRRDRRRGVHAQRGCIIDYCHPRCCAIYIVIRYPAAARGVFATDVCARTRARNVVVYVALTLDDARSKNRPSCLVDSSCLTRKTRRDARKRSYQLFPRDLRPLDARRLFHHRHFRF